MKRLFLGIGNLSVSGTFPNWKCWYTELDFFLYNLNFTAVNAVSLPFRPTFGSRHILTSKHFRLLFFVGSFKNQRHANYICNQIFQLSNIV